MATARLAPSGEPDRTEPERGGTPVGLSAVDAVQVAHALPDGVVLVDADGVIRFVNARFCAMTGYSDAQLVGSPVDALVPLGLRATHAANRAAFAATPAVRSMGANLDTRCLCADGHELEVDIALSTIDSATGRTVLAAVRDATDRKALERERRETEERFHLLVDAVRDYAIFMLDPTGHVVTWNAGAERLNGYTADEIVGEHFSVFHAPADIAAGRPESLLATAAAEGRVEETGWRVRKDGSRFLAMVTVTALTDRSGILRGFAKITRDVTDVQRARDELERLRLLEQRERLGRDLHDGVIQSIFAVGMRLQSILSVTADPEAARRIDTAITELDDTIRDIREYIFELGRDRSAVSLEAELDQLSADHRARTGMTTVLSVDPAALGVLQPHAATVLMVTKEALSNVARHSGAATVRVTVRREDDEALLEVDDDGRGFDLEHAAAGLGMANARARAESVGGRYDVVTGPDGTAVRFAVGRDAGE